MRQRNRSRFERLAEISFQNIGRNMRLSLATTVMMGLILFIFNVIMVLNVLTQASLDKVSEKVDLIVYLTNEISPLEVENLLADVRSIPIVTSANYTSSDVALQNFLADYPEKADPFQNYDIANPLPASIQMVTVDPEDHSLVTDYLKESAWATYLLDVESSGENQEIIARLVHVTNFTKTLIIGVIITFVFGSILIIVNAIHLSIFTRKREIQIMQLVGAEPGIIRFPFIFEGVVYSIVAVFFSFFLLMFFLEGSNLADFTAFDESFSPLALFIFELIGTVAIGIGASLLALKYYLKRTLILE